MTGFFSLLLQVPERLARQPHGTCSGSGRALSAHVPRSRPKAHARPPKDRREKNKRIKQIFLVHLQWIFGFLSFTFSPLGYCIKIRFLVYPTCSYTQLHWIYTQLHSTYN